MLTPKFCEQLFSCLSRFASLSEHAVISRAAKTKNLSLLSKPNGNACYACRLADFRGVRVRELRLYTGISRGCREKSARDNPER